MTVQPWLALHLLVSRRRICHIFRREEIGQAYLKFLSELSEPFKTPEHPCLAEAFSPWFWRHPICLVLATCSGCLGFSHELPVLGISRVLSRSPFFSHPTLASELVLFLLTRAIAVFPLVSLNYTYKLGMLSLELQ